MMSIPEILQDCAHLVYACSHCKVLHTVGYRCETMRRADRMARFYPVNGVSTVQIRKVG